MAPRSTPRTATAPELKPEEERGMIGVHVGIAALIAYLPFGGMKDSQFADIKTQDRMVSDFYTEPKIITDWHRPEAQA
jgi:malonate-semialdehyde dehydrogenase (acetylating)/methylmalonate-semialdehyde dehydrogenase